MSLMTSNPPMPTNPSPGAITGLRVIDLTRVLGGPYCTQILADHGADVVKVEPPAGDEVRDWGPPFHDDDAAYFVGINRNKRSIDGESATTCCARNFQNSCIAGFQALAAMARAAAIPATTPSSRP